METPAYDTTLEILKGKEFPQVCISMCPFNQVNQFKIPITWCDDS